MSFGLRLLFLLQKAQPNSAKAVSENTDAVNDDDDLDTDDARQPLIASTAL